MSIWTYKDWRAAPEILKASIGLETCAFCSEVLEAITSGTAVEAIRLRMQTDEVRVCPCCGWWWLCGHRQVDEGNGRKHLALVGSIGSLANFDVSDQSAPLDEIRKYLCARYGSRFDVDPAKYEDVVASVFADLAFQAEAVGRSGDGGIDVVLTNSAGERIGVQVRRWRNTIQVEQLRGLVGALVLHGLTKGVFVTTSRFTAGARPLSGEAALRGLRLELVDAPRFYEALKLAQPDQYRTLEDKDAPWLTAPLVGYQSLGVFHDGEDPESLARRWLTRRSS